MWGAGRITLKQTRRNQEGIMKIRQVTNVAVAGVIAFMLAGGSAFAQGGQMRERAEKARSAEKKVTNLDKLVMAKIDFLMQNREQLQLTEDQVGQIEQIQQQYQQDKDDIEQQQEQVKNDLRSAVEAEQFDATQVRNLLMEYYNLEQQIGSLAVDTLSQLNQVLTDAQRQMMRSMLQLKLEGMFKEGREATE